MKVLIITNRRFNDFQFWTMVKVLKANKIDFDVMSTSKFIVEEDTKRRFCIKYTFENTPDLDQYTGLMLVSGHPEDTKAYWHDKRLEKIVRAFSERTVGGICAATASVRYIANGKKVTSYPLQMVRQLLELAGAIIYPVPVVADGNLVTGDNELVAGPWTEAFIKVMKGEDPDLHYQPIEELRKLKDRKPIAELERMRRNGSPDSNSVEGD